ncbi:MAG: hypothetical protein QME42_01600, partial [bacterium]|nr:hypothetical protein [bacterium]
MAISVAEYDIIRKIVDDKMKMYNKRLDEIKAEKIDFNELKKEVATLTKNVDRLVQIQVETKQDLAKTQQEIAKAQAETRQEIAKAQAETRQEIAKTQAETRQELANAQQEIAK